MFVQIIQGQVADADGLRARFQQWLDDVRPGAIGFLGSTGGVTDDGRAIVLARFESAEAAQQNASRPVQDAWWNATEPLFSGEPEFHETEDVTTMLDGGSDEAGFVQIMQGRTDRRSDFEVLEKQSEDLIREVQPGLIGSVRCWYGDGEYTDAIYFTDEDTARAGEKAMGEHPEFQKMFADWQDFQPEVTYFDLRDPMLASP